MVELVQNSMKLVSDERRGVEKMLDSKATWNEPRGTSPCDPDLLQI